MSVDPIRTVHDWLAAVNAGDVEGALALTEALAILGLVFVFVFDSTP